ncbi:MAG: hypothetical protein H0W67_07110 [Gemmatimonadales bacterium]|nr:hypothetical protein [Gemmatimonadales bacterium]
MLHPVPMRRRAEAALTLAVTLTLAIPASLWAQSSASIERAAPHWPDPVLDRRYQCQPGSTAARRAGAVDESRAAVTLWLPGVREAQTDGGCLRLTVDGAGSARLAALALRGVGVSSRSLRLDVVKATWTRS